MHQQLSACNQFALESIRNQENLQYSYFQQNQFKSKNNIMTAITVLPQLRVADKPGQAAVLQVHGLPEGHQHHLYITTKNTDTEIFSSTIISIYIYSGADTKTRWKNLIWSSLADYIQQLAAELDSLRVS